MQCVGDSARSDWLLPQKSRRLLILYITNSSIDPEFSAGQANKYGNDFATRSDRLKKI
jgi:hypothetical protein